MKDKLSVLDIMQFGVDTKHSKGLTKDEASHIKEMLDKCAKVAVELECNLPELLPSNCFMADREIDKSYDYCLSSCDNYCNPKCIVPNCDIKDQWCDPSDCLLSIPECMDCNKVANCDSCINPFSVMAPNRAKISQELKPLNSISYAKGVNEVTVDGSLIGDRGVEVTSIGQMVDYNSIYNTWKKIIDVVVENNGWVNERCSTHVHLLTGHITHNNRHEKGYRKDRTSIRYNSLEEPIPEVVVANFHQLCRRYEHALQWMFATGSSVGHLTRWVKFRQPILLMASPLLESMCEVNTSIQKECETAVKKPKYSTISYFYSSFDSNSDAEIFHVEARFADGNLCTAAIASLGCLLFSMLMKAVDISRYGIISVGSEDTIKRINKLSNILVNNNGDYNSLRVSETAEVLDYISEYQEDSLELLILVEPYLKRLGDAYDVLTHLANRPICLLRALDNLSWEEINRHLDPKYQTKITKDRSIDRILEIIDLNQAESKSRKDWNREVSKITGLDQKKVKGLLSFLISKNEIKWSERAQTYIRF